MDNHEISLAYTVNTGMTDILAMDLQSKCNSS